jgi:hypothetical protein
MAKKMKPTIEPDINSKSGIFEEDKKLATIEEPKFTGGIKEVKEKRNLFQFMSEEKAISRWVVLRIGLLGMMAGAIMGFIVAMLGIIKI